MIDWMPSLAECLDGLASIAAAWWRDASDQGVSAVRSAAPLPVLAAALQDVGLGSLAWPIGLALAAVLALTVALAVLLRRSRHQAAELARREADVARREAELAERQLKEAYYKAHYDSTTDSIFVMKVEDDGRFTMVDRNPAHEATFGGSEIVGKELHHVMSDEQAKYLTSFYEQCIATRGPIRYVLDFPVNGEPRTWETVEAPVFDESGKITHIIGATRDITDRLELEEKLRQSQKMEAIGQLTGGIAHDFNNLLTVVLGNLDLLKRAREETKPKLIDNALQAIERARELTQKLLAFGRRQPLKPEPTDLKALIAGMDDMLMQSLRGDIRLELDLPDDLWPVEVDQAQLQVALINLAANARDAMPKGGMLRVRAENTTTRDGERFEGVAISVSDSGHGMSQDVLARAFEPFFTTKEVGRGTGLGLAQVYGFAQQSGGSVGIRSKVGAGTTVTLHLPRAQVRALPAHATSADSGWMDRPLHILLVEDNVQVAEVAASILSEHGHLVTTAYSADEALPVLEGDHTIEFVFSDLVMPGERDGLDLARIVRRRWPGLPILLASGYSEAAGRATQEGFVLLPKPYRASALVATIQRLAGEAERPLEKAGSAAARPR